MTSRVIVPHRGLEHAKTRLAGVLDPDQRATLAERLLRHVLEATAATGHPVVVISPDENLEAIATACGARLTVQRGMGLNAGLRQARDEAVGDGVEALAVLHGDLPALTTPDVVALLDAVRVTGPSVAIAPDAAETGTNALALAPPEIIDFSFGEGSLIAHRRAAKRAGAWLTIVRRPGLAFDIDTPQDLAAWLAAVHAA